MISKYLMKLFGEGDISEDDVDKIVYSSDIHGISGSASLVVWPRNVEQVHQLVLYARRNKRDLVVRGSGTNLVGGCVPNNSIVVDFSRMNKILQMSTARNYVVVEPGVILAYLNNVLMKLDFKFPIVPYSYEVSSVGGMIGSNSVGFGSFKYGKIRDWVSELEIIDGSGKLMTLKGSLLDDFCGSEGVLGIVVKAKLKFINNERTYFKLYEYDDEYDLIKKVKKLMNLEYVVSVEFVNKIVSKVREEEMKSYLIVECVGDEESDEVFELREGVYNILCRYYPYVDCCFIPLNKMYLFLSFLLKNSIPCFGHIGVGVVYFCFNDKVNVNRIWSYVKRIGGSAVNFGMLRKDFVDKEFLDKIKRLKKQYDPENILNVGKVLR